MLPVLHLGPLAIQTPGLILLIGIWLGLAWVERYSSRFKIEAGSLYNLAWIGLISGLLGARLAFAAQYFSLFLANPLNLLSLTPTMFNVEAGLLIGILAASIYAQRVKLPFWKTLDGLTPGLSLFMAAVHLSNLAGGNAYGTPTTLPWAIQLWGEARHPVQTYEFAAALGIAFGISRPLKRPATPGLVFWTFIALTALSRLFMDIFHGEAQTLPGGIHFAQVIAWLVLAICLWQLRPKQDPAQPSEMEETHVSS